MNYIVMDLEWNQSYNGHLGEHPRMPFEIIEIGAVKVDKNYKIIDEYSSLIKPRIYKRLHSKIRTILNYTEKDFEKGRGFKEVCIEFLEWCGEDYMFCTWGNMDLTELQTNMDFYYMNRFPRPLKYINLQQIYADITKSADTHVSCKLESAVTSLSIPETEPFHSALNDARYTALVMKAINPKNIKELYCFDLYHYPADKDEEIEAIHNNQYEYITRAFSSKQAAMSDKNVSDVRCYKCNKKITKKIKWFSNSTSSYLCVGKCWRHGNFCGKIKFKPAADGKYYVIKTFKPIDKAGIEAIYQKQADIRQHRKEKRHSKNRKIRQA